VSGERTVFELAAPGWQGDHEEKVPWSFNVRT
jgi:hypothetical protein